MYMAGLPEWRGTLVSPPEGTLAPAVRDALARRSSCVPPGHATLTYYTPAHAELRQTQLERIRTRPCFMARLVTVCFGFSNSSTNTSACNVHAPSIFGRRARTFRTIGCKRHKLADVELGSLLRLVYSIFTPTPHISPYHHDGLSQITSSFGSSGDCFTRR